MLKRGVDMVRKPFSVMVTVTLICTLGGGAAGPASAAPKCTAKQGQAYINAGRYQDAIREFTCLIEAQPTAPEGYRGRIEAELLLGQYSNALSDHGRIIASVLPVHPDAAQTIADGYAARLAVGPQDIPALTGGSFAHWTASDYAQAIHLLNRLLEVQPHGVFGPLFRGSSRLLHHSTTADGIADLERAITLAS